MARRNLHTDEGFKRHYTHIYVNALFKATKGRGPVFDDFFCMLLQMVKEAEAEAEAEARAAQRATR